MQTWIDGTTTPAEMRDKAKVDDDFHMRLLHYISSLITETLLPKVSDDNLEQYGDVAFGWRAFQPFPDPSTSDTEFETLKQLDVYDLVSSRNIHSQSHTPTCFKYRHKKCRSKFPRVIVDETNMDTETGLIQLQRDDAWLNGYNP